MRAGVILFLLCLLLVGTPNVRADSICYGTPSDGALEKGCKLPASGDNFRAYSRLGHLLGRTWLHCDVADAVTDAFATLNEQRPETIYVYGETGHENGGPFSPHKTHQNGLSADFMVPVLDERGASAPLPGHALNKFGYALEFDKHGKLDELRIDYEALADHLLALADAAQARGAPIRRVIFALELQPFLHATQAWPKLKDRVTFSTRPSWVRHDEHYHVDFEALCEPLKR